MRIADIYPLTPLQKGLLFHTLYAPEAAAYFEQLSCTLEGTLEQAAFAAAWQQVVDRHAILRTAFVTKGQRQPVQVVFDQVPFPVHAEDWRGLRPEAQQERLEAFLVQDRQQGFALNRPPLMRLTLMRLAENVWQFVWSHHHLLLDGWSQPILLRECFTLYAAALAKRRVVLPQVRPYGDYLAWLQRQDIAAAEDFWRATLQGLQAPTPLGIGRASAATPAVASAMHDLVYDLAPEQTAALAQCARHCRVTLNTVVQGAWAVVLSRYSGSDDIVFGITVSGRPVEVPGAQEMVGLLINTLPLRVQIDGNQTLAAWLGELQHRQVEMRRFEYSSLPDIHGWSDVPTGTPLFESLLSFENFPLDRSLLTPDVGLTIRNVAFLERTHYALTLGVIPGKRLRLKVGYDAGRLEEREAYSLCEHISHVLAQMVTAPEQRLAALSLLPPAAVTPPATVIASTQTETTLDQRFADAVRQHRERIALTYEGQNWTYNAIDRASNRLARFFQGIGVGPEVRVAICLEREPDLIVAMLAVTKAGGVYVPLDPAYPPERLAYLIADSNATLVYTKKALQERLAATTSRIVCLDDAEDAAAIKAADTAPLPAARLGPENGAYVIYTSGSTGMPKGVLVSHGNVLRLFESTEALFGFTQQDVWTFFHSFAFDFSVWEIWGALLYGGRLVIVPYFLSRNPQAFYDLLSTERVTVLNQTPSAFRNLVAVEDALPTAPRLALRYVIFGGEALHVESLRSWRQRHGEEHPRLINMYGITETTVHVTYRPLRRVDLDHAGGSLIGQPLPDLRLYILDAYGHVLPDGIAGEVYVGGAGLARGYLHRPALSAERFVAHPYPTRPGERLYRTGDLARRLPDGEIAYLGRIDHQVQIRGFRIELGEIRAALRQHRAVREELVLASETADGETRLLAYLVCAPDERPSVEQLRAFLQDRLPDYMIPAAFVFLEQFPLTPNGKVNLRALPSPETSRAGLEVPYRPPVNAAEKTLAAIWQEVLGVERVGLDDNYFALGGDSMHSIRIASLAREQGWQVSLQQLFQLQTIGRLAEAMQDAGAAQAPASLAPFALITPEDRALLPADSEDAYALARLQAGMFFHGDYGDARTLYQDLFSFRLRLPFDYDTCVRAMRETVQAHPVLRTSFHFDTYSQPLQVVHTAAEVEIAYEDLRHLSPQAQEDRLTAWYGQERARGYDWGQAPLLRLHLHHLHDDVIQCSLSFHHAILDGWSVATCLAELMQRYLHLLGRGVPPVPPPAAGVLRDFVALEQAALAAAEQRQFWQTTLASMSQARLTRWPGYGQALPGGAPIHREDRTFDPALTRKLLALARQAGVPLKSVLLAVHLRLLSVLVGQPQVVTGLVSNGRPETRDSERALGLFLNTVPLSFSLPAGSWLDLIAAVFEAEETLLPYRRFPMAQLQRLYDGQPLFETSFNYVHFHVFAGLLDLRDVEVLAVTSFEETEIPFSVTFSSDVDDARLRMSVSYDSSEFAAAQIHAVLEYYQHLLGAMADDPTAPYAAVEVLTPAERDDLLSARNATMRTWAGMRLVHEQFEHQVRSTPDAPAVVWQDMIWTYADLNRHANRLAHYLLACGAGPERAVALCVERSYQMVVGLLAILKAGACYVPIDPEYPGERMAAMVAASGAHVLLTTTALLPRLPVDETSITVCCDRDAALLAAQAETNPAVAVDGEHLAYLLFTSGSTGRPKGVAIRHAALANHMAWMQEAYPLTRDDVVLQKTPFIFDASVWEFWAPLMVGAQLLLAKEGGQQDPAYVVDTVQRQGVTILQVVPSLLEVLLTEPGLPACHSLRRLFCGGEALTTALKERLQSLLQVPLLNLYGPTETTIQCASWVCREHEVGATIPIGEAVANTQLYVLDTALRPVPIGVVGDLYIGGRGLARGYANNPGLTAAAFVPHPFATTPGARLYRSGDLARHLPERGLEFLGRGDDQVKLRGFRIELGEIEATVARYPGVRRNVARVCSDGSGAQRLVVYIEWAGASPDEEADLRTYLRTYLPAYMLPTWFETIEAWPVLPNGKINRRALPLPQFSRHEQGRPYRAPRGEVETALLAIWQEVLGVPRLGVDDNFFELGGDSILSLQIVARARAQGLRLSPRDLFEHATVAALAPVVGRATAVPEAQSARCGEVPLTPIQHAFFAQERQYPEHWNQAIVLHVDPGLAVADLEQSLADVVAVHDAFHLRFTREHGIWRQFYGDAATSWHFSAIDLTGMAAPARTEAIATAAGAAQADLRLETGPLFRALYFSCGAHEQARLVLVAHHLVVDGVSWRILVQDLTQACQARRLGSAPVAAPPLSFGSWARQLAAQAGTLLSAAEGAFWQQQVAGPAVPLPVDNAYGRHRNTEKSVATVMRQLTSEETAALLLHAPGALRARVPEILVTALAEALGHWSGGNDVYISMEGHGREALLSDADVSGTAGWFTALYPVRLRLLPQGTPIQNLKTIKEQLRRIPNGGVGYGLLRYLCQQEEASQQLAAVAVPELSFNYFGQLNVGQTPEALFSLGSEPTGLSRAPEEQRDYLLDMVAAVADNRLTMQWHYSTEVHWRTTLEALAEHFLEALRRLLAAAATCGQSSLSPSDFPLAALDAESLQQALDGSKDVEELYPLTPVQEGMLFHTLYASQGGMYMQQVSGRWTGACDPVVLELAWQTVLARHANLRAAFLALPRPRALQRIEREVQIPVELHEWTALAPAEQEARWQQLLVHDRERGFALEQPPLMRFALVQLADHAWRFLWTHHHLLLDGWSVPIVFSELLRVYQALRAQETPPLLAAPRFRSYVAWLQQQNQDAAAQFWRTYLHGFTHPTALPTPDAARRHASGAATAGVQLGAALTAQLRDFAAQHRLTVNTVLQGAWALLLSRYTGSDDVVFGVTVAGRPPELEGVEKMVGMFINTLPFRAVIAPHAAPAAWLATLQEHQAEVSRYEYSRLVDIHACSDVSASEALFDTIMIHQNYPIEQELRQQTTAEFAVEDIAVVEENNYPLTLYTIPGASLAFSCLYQQERFSAAHIQRLLEHLAQILRGFVAADRGVLGDIDLLSASEREHILHTWQPAARPYRREHLVHQRIAEQAARTPDASAVVCADAVVSYAALERFSNRLARRLQRLGVGPEVPVAICLQRSIALVEALLGILKTGGTYVPLDPAYPSQRLAWMLEDSQARLLVTESALLPYLPASGVPVLLLDSARADIETEAADPVASGVTSDNLAYTIFTSGSSGRPKGVQISHAALVNFLQSFQRTPGLSSDDVLAAVTTLCFDISALEIYLPLLSGARLLLVDRDTTVSGIELANVLSRYGATVLQATPATWRLLVAGEWQPAASFRAWCGGEALPSDLAQALLHKGVDLINVYGPTETTIWSAMQAVHTVPDAQCIAQPLDNTTVYILDTAGRLVPPGMVGQVYIGGAGVARGYLHRPDLTAASFVPNPFSVTPGARLYDTGDLARYTHDGRVELLGRADYQVKMRGFRIETGEIEAALRDVPAVRDAVVLARQDTPGEKQLVAYIVCREGQARPDFLRQHLLQRLPDYMIPSAWIDVPALPLTPNGKIDRRALPAPEASTGKAAFVPPRDAVEEALADIWQEVFSRDTIGRHDNFFDLGGHSLMATQIHAKIRQFFHVEVRLRDLFQVLTIAELAAFLKAREARPGRSEAVARAYLRLQRMSPEERAALLQQQRRA